MTEPRNISRPLRHASRVARASEHAVERRFRTARVLLRLDAASVPSVAARETLLLALNLLLRIGVRPTLELPRDAAALAERCEQLVIDLLGGEDELDVAVAVDTRAVEVVLSVGETVRRDIPWIAVSSDAWLARMTTSRSPLARLPRCGGSANVLGALAAACLAVGQVFDFLVGKPLAEKPVELSLLTYEVAHPGDLDRGPEFPADPPKLDALLVGCGSVMNGWAYAVRLLPIVGGVQAVDYQRLGEENFGTYALWTLQRVGAPKPEIIREALAPAIDVIPRSELFEPLFTVRLDRGHFALPALVVNGLDNVPTRHAVQRRWPKTVVDIGAGGETAQLIVKHSDIAGQCLIGALVAPPESNGDLDSLVARTGLSAEALRAAPDVPITAEDIATAPPEHREALEAARRAGVLRCGYVTISLAGQESGDEFEAAVPHVAVFAGVAAAAATLKELMGLGEAASLNFQFSFASRRARTMRASCASDCECRERETA